MEVRHVIGGLYAVIAIIFLAVNSYVLGSFGYKFAHDEWAKYGFALVAGAVPWALAPHLHVMAAKARMLQAMGRHNTIWGRLRHNWRVLMGLIPFIIVYALFVGYNVLGGTGATAFQRAHLSDERKHVIKETGRLEAQRKALQDQIDGIPKHRPAATVRPLLDATKIHRFWARTNGCTDVTARQSRDFCAEVKGLEAELASAQAADQLFVQIRELDGKLSEDRRQSSDEDPQISFLSELTGWSKQRWLFILLLSTPVILEVGALIFGRQALELLNVHLEMEAPVRMPPRLVDASVRSSSAASSPSPVRDAMDNADASDRHSQRLHAVTVHLGGDDPRRMRAVFDEFWAHRTRRVDGAQVPEVTLYEHYRSMCAERRVSPYDIGTFRTLASEKITDAVWMNGQMWLIGVVHCDEITA